MCSVKNLKIENSVFQPNRISKTGTSPERQYFKISIDLGNHLKCKVHQCRKHYYVGGGPLCHMHRKLFYKKLMDSRGNLMNKNVQLIKCKLPNCPFLSMRNSEFCAMHESRDLRFVDILDYQNFLHVGRTGG